MKCELVQVIVSSVCESKCLWTTFLAEHFYAVLIQKGFGLDLMRNLSIVADANADADDDDDEK